MAVAAGQKIGPYEVAGQIGAGGMGEVYKARDPRLGRDVAIKVLPPSFSSDPDRLQRFAQEARAAAALNHPNILAIFDIGEDKGAPYVVSELLEGETLRDRLRSGAMSTRKAIDFALQIAHGLAAAHEKGIVHRDLKPENLFITHDNRMKILDFGLAKLTHPEEHSSSGDAPTMQVATDPGVVMGTVGYMSPEQVRGKPADHRSDIFSFGSILYEMLSGKRAFHGDSPADTDERDPERRSAGTLRNRSQHSTGPATDREPLPGEKSEPAFSVSWRCGFQSRIADRNFGLQQKRDACGGRPFAVPAALAASVTGCASVPDCVCRNLFRSQAVRSTSAAQLPSPDFPPRYHPRRALFARWANDRVRRRT